MPASRSDGLKNTQAYDTTLRYKVAKLRHSPVKTPYNKISAILFKEDTSSEKKHLNKSTLSGFTNTKKYSKSNQPPPFNDAWDFGCLHPPNSIQYRAHASGELTCLPCKVAKRDLQDYIPPEVTLEEIEAAKEACERTNLTAPQAPLKRKRKHGSDSRTQSCKRVRPDTESNEPQEQPTEGGMPMGTPAAELPQLPVQSGYYVEPQYAGFDNSYYGLGGRPMEAPAAEFWQPPVQSGYVEPQYAGFDNAYYFGGRPMEAPAAEFWQDLVQSGGYYVEPQYAGVNNETGDMMPAPAM